MGQHQALIVYGSDEQSELVETVTRLGYLPVIRGNVLNILRLIRYGGFTAIIIDSDNLKEDALELVLNVRDINSKIPIIWVGSSISNFEKRVLDGQENVAVTNLFSAEKLKERIKDMQNVF